MRATSRRAFVAILLAGILGLLPMVRAQAPPHPQRIISIVPALTEMLFAMGAGDAVVGVSSYDHFPAAVETRARVGALVDPDYERILSLRPDLVVVYGTQRDLITRLEQAHLPMFSYAHAGLADITATMRALGARVGHQAEAEARATEIDRSLADIRRRVAGDPKPKTLLVFGREAGTLRGIYASAGVGFLHDMLEVAGGIDVFADVKRESIQASVEQILARAPEVILEVRVGGGLTPDRLPEELRSWRGLPSVPAVRTGRLFLLTDDVLVIPGPRVVDATLLIAKALHPDKFK
jgi:iron complex transport system substrate-binding protein